MALSKLAVRRLTKLADFMEKLPRKSWEHFHMASWFDHTGNHDHGFGRSITQKDLHQCGTTACALGWAATLPAFKKQGLSMDRRGNIRWSSLSGSRTTHGMDFFTPESQDRALCAHGILFGGTESTPKQWAAMCRRFIRENSC